MCTITLSYDQNNALARRKLAALLATGLFTQQTTDHKEPTQDGIFSWIILKKAWQMSLHVIYEIPSKRYR